MDHESYIRKLFLSTFTSLLLAIGGSFQPLHGQNAKVGKPLFDSVALMAEISEASVETDVAQAILKLDAAAKKCEGKGFSYGAAKAYCTEGTRHKDLSAYSDAKRCADKASAMATLSGDASLIASCNNLTGTIHFLMGDYPSASKAYFMALSGLKNIDSSTFKVAITVYTNLVALYGRMNEQEKVRYYVALGERIARDTTLTHGKANTLLASLLISKGNYFERNHLPDSAIATYNEALPLLKNDDVNELNRSRMHALICINLGAAALQKEAYSDAAKYCREGISLAKGKYAFLAISGSYALGEALRNLKQFDEAERVLLYAVSESGRLKTRDQLITGYGTLINVYREKGSFEKALAYTDTLDALKDTLLSAEKANATSRFEAKYQLAEKDRQIARNQLLIVEQNANIKWNKLLLTGIIIVISLLSLFGVVYFLVSKQKQRLALSTLEQKNTISILKGVVQGAENERVRLARDLHDGIGGMLSATKMRFMALRHQHSELNHSPQYMEAMGLLDVMGDEIRKTSHNLMPNALLKQELQEALRNYCNEITALSTMQVDFQSFGTFNHMTSEFKLNVYRIVQELLKNVDKHAHATYVVVQLMMLDAYLTLSVEDNGIGFEVAQTRDGIGLHNLKARVSGNNGHFTIKSSPGTGTSVFIEFELAGNVNL